VPAQSLTSAAPTPQDPAESGTAMTLHAHLTALPGLLAEADLAEAHVEARDRRTGALVAYSFVTIHRALALHVAEAVRAALARLDLEAGRDGVGHDPGRAPEALDAEAPVSSDHRPGQYL
jgi:uncharacterized membrane protein